MWITEEPLEHHWRNCRGEATWEKNGNILVLPFLSAVLLLLLQWQCCSVLQCSTVRHVTYSSTISRIALDTVPNVLSHSCRERTWLLFFAISPSALHKHIRLLNNYNVSLSSRQEDPVRRFNINTILLLWWSVPCQSTVYVQENCEMCIGLKNAVYRTFWRM